ncbi:hypothetical protein J4T94_gp123 [Mycobacterium phage Krypton555]|uniref:Uncharacterized protein n=1 Tax=Mycobacterium phage Krypton555 TaxID=2015885 RepID=A0A222ZRR1_9CAUD|nr:hypothetical protein J4T94_gp123 [Mycobacterium phage Krypton555]ASR87095.1 hypothetical protein KRYPTON555_59 [Mycobacterium phage Krypton555]
MIEEALLTTAVMLLIILWLFVPWYVIAAIAVAFGAGFVYGGGTYEFPRRG